MNRQSLILVTKEFPYSSGESFLEAEVPYLAAQFDKVIIAPLAIKSMPRALPQGVEVEPGLAQRFSTPIRKNVLTLIRHPVELGLCLIYAGLRHPGRLFQAIGNLYRILATEEWFNTFLNTRENHLGTVLIYHYWTTVSIVGAKLATIKRLHVTNVVSRAHGGDLYETWRGDHDWPYRNRVMRSVDRLFLISSHGMTYVSELRPWMKGKCELSRLGVQDFGLNPSVPMPNGIVVCSCAAFLPVKRINLLIQGLGIIGNHYTQERIVWHHFGDGPLRTDMESLAKACLPANVQYIFHGQQPNSSVRNFYHSNHIDVFVNTSLMEGLPVSIMEAQSAGIPVIATAVGGTSELINQENGFLLPHDVSAQQISEAISDVMINRSAWNDRRYASRKTWSSMSDANMNHSEFTQRLLAFCQKHS